MIVESMLSFDDCISCAFIATSSVHLHLLRCSTLSPFARLKAIYSEAPLPQSVHALLKELAQKSFNATSELKQYPTLRVEVGNARFESLDRMKEESKETTMQLVDMECGYLTVEFFRKLPQDIEKGGNPTHSLFDRYNDSYLRRVGHSSST